ncbi:MAG: hypothetical protein WHS43_02735 [Aquificaceae bacterium]|jgi:recombinational DNA repair protein (RecF pathway)|uniref:hypothetical protein n=1 Tax=Hydrogenobacter sp. Uz 6-8 TaxID=3384828 RepID=UPI000F1281F2|nr:MAG: hypothetical protein D6804_04695 [Aquificota bacterium]
MSAKGSFLILRRFRAGDEDIMLKAYGTCGPVKVFVPGGLKVDRGLLGYLEAFNLISFVYRQSGSLIIFDDLIEVEFISYLCLGSYQRFVWMNSIALFVERWFLQYDPELFNMALFYITLNPQNHGLFLSKFKLDFLRRLGLYKEEVFEERLRGLVRRLMEEEALKRLERLKVSQELLSRLEDAIEAHLSSSL